MKLQPLENTVVNLRTQEEYDEYMKLAEEAGWRWKAGGLPTSHGYWYLYDSKACVEICNRFSNQSTDYYTARSYTILTLPELKAKFGIGLTYNASKVSTFIFDKKKSEPWSVSYTKDGTTISQDKIVTPEKTYTFKELQEEVNKSRKLMRAYKKFFPQNPFNIVLKVDHKKMKSGKNSGVITRIPPLK